MEHIFDWLREQMRERIKAYQTLDTTETAVDVAIKETDRFIEYINEAEDKWEAECCEYEYHVAPSKDIYYLTSCKNRHNGRLWTHEPYCRYCGKPIKISEVE